MNKETYTQWYEGLKNRLTEGQIDQKGFESLLIGNLQSLIVRVYNTRYDSEPMSREALLEIINHYFELIADTDVSNQTALLLIRTVASNIKNLPAVKVFAEKHNAPMPPFSFLISKPSRKDLEEGMARTPGWHRKRVASTTDAMLGRPVITQVDKPNNEVTIELPWKLALHVYNRFLIKELMSNHNFNYHDAYNYVAEHRYKYNELLEQILNKIIAHKESHLVSVGGGITAAGTGLVVSGVIKPAIPDFDGAAVSDEEMLAILNKVNKTGE